MAIAIPVFTSQLEKSREATDLANLRSAYAEQMTGILTWDGTDAGKPANIHVTAKQTQANWQSAANATSTKIGDGYDKGAVEVVQSTTGWTVAVDTSGTEPKVTIAAD